MPTTLQQWKSLPIDWSLIDAKIAVQVGLSRERIRQVRRKLGLNASQGSTMSPNTQAMMDWIDNNRDMAGLITVDELAAKGDGRLRQAYHAAKRKGFKLARKRQGVEPDARYALMNFDLPNRDLVRIWRFVDAPSQKPGFRIGQYRYLHTIGRPRWDGRQNLEGNAEYQAAYEAEVAKAKAYFGGAG